MSNFFNMDNGFFSALGKICDMLLLSLVWLILCIPIITIGPATTALYYATVKVIRKERGYLFREFFRSFRSNFKRASIVGVILTIIYGILAFDLVYAYGTLSVDHNKGSIYLGIFLALTLLVVSFGIYVFPILSRFEMTVRQLFKAGIFMSMRHLPYTIVMAVIFVGAIYALVMTNFLLMFILPSLVMFLNSFMMERVFRKYMPESEGPGEETGKDEWYLE